MDSRYDYIVVGAGSAGCVLANRLSENLSHSVCLIEAGPKDSSPFFDIPAAFPYFMFSKKYNWAYSADPDEKIRSGESLFVPRGKSLGGSSSINAMAYVRGNPRDFDGWSEQGNHGWDYNSLLPYFKKSEKHSFGVSTYHGGSGPLFVEEFSPKYPVSQSFLSASLQAGYFINHDFNGQSQEGVGPYQYNIKNGKRCGVSQAYLKPVLSRPNLTVLVNAQVKKIAVDGKEATGVLVNYEDSDVHINADKEVIVSAGAINSPQLLMLSGIGDQDELSKAGLRCNHHLPGVGKNLQEHVDACVLVESKKSKGITTSSVGLLRWVPEVFQYIFKGRGKLSNPIVEVGGFIKSDESVEQPDVQLGLLPLLFDDNGRDLNLMRTGGYSCHVCILRPKSRGTITLNSSSYKDPPRINFNFFSDSRDKEVLVNGIKRAREILSQDAFKPFEGTEIHPGQNIQTDEEIFSKALEKLGTVFHPVGTCKMGEGAEAVVDKDLKVHGIKKLRVVDASIMPNIVSANTNAATIAIAEKASDLIKSLG